MKSVLFITAMGFLWVVMLMLTLQAIHFQGTSATLYYYGGMLEKTWQAHFNVDLLIHTTLLACWIIYREKSKIAGVICGMLSIYIGAFFSILYVIFIYVRSKGDLSWFLTGNEESKDMANVTQQ